MLCELFPSLQEFLKSLFYADASLFYSTIRWAFLRESAGRFLPHCQLKQWNYIQFSSRYSARGHPSVEDRRGEQSRTVSQERDLVGAQINDPAAASCSSEKRSVHPLWRSRTSQVSCCFNWHHSERDQKHRSDIYVYWDVKHKKYWMIRLSYVHFTVNESRIMSWLSGAECLLFQCVVSRKNRMFSKKQKCICDDGQLVVSDNYSVLGEVQLENCISANSWTLFMKTKYSRLVFVLVWCWRIRTVMLPIKPVNNYSKIQQESNSYMQWLEYIFSIINAFLSTE